MYILFFYFFYFSTFQFWKFSCKIFNLIVFFIKKVVLLKFFFRNVVFYIKLLTKNVNFVVFYFSIFTFFQFLGFFSCKIFNLFIFSLKNVVLLKYFFFQKCHFLRKTLTKNLYFAIYFSNFPFFCFGSFFM